MTDAKLCPRDATPEMLVAGQAAMNEQLGKPAHFARSAYRAFWQGAWDAAPPTPEAEEVSRLRACEAALRELVRILDDVSQVGYAAAIDAARAALSGGGK